MQPWQVFHAARKYLGPDSVARIFNKEKRSAYSWGQDPDYTEHRCKSPLELLHVLFARMDDVGVGYVARAAIRYLETAVEADVLFDSGQKLETMPTITEEVLADYSAVASLQLAIDEGRPLEDVKSRATAAVAEIHRTVAKYAEDRLR